MKITKELVTPDLAKEMLAGNVGNRAIRQGWVNELARRISDGEWKLSPQGVTIASDGRLIDGQHRLHAVVKAGAAVEMMVARDVDANVFDVMDQGVRRSMADIYGHDRRVADVISLATAITFWHHSTSPARYALVANTDLFRVATDLVEFCPTKARFFSSARVKLAAVITVVRNPEWRDYVFSTYAALVHQDYLAMSPAAMALNKQVVAGVVKSVNAETLPRAMIAFDKTRWSVTRIQISESSLMNAYNTVRDTVRGLIGEND
ncbi:MAG: hypothetical protein D6811_10190 [Alphaproteobacteria bacterium]|nr:MAG: hypothetical protein D6811_10190 [Alphaproteobacteria bacterium]